ncbi:hypothetical protein DMN91_005529 [Ooceraea biroi]|uniref:Enkurin domain-containing protein n=1 Tax=Ooceraea biroi TaxID=2015173 RepID=A0A026VZ75_OOCBI|nr:uncharacterized protein LOC105285854 [Ooceraea biroi]XP_011348685.1 uncharacterized protein LOC105285854 [Ooceraea biroi]EZA48144.1 hypothetical protein X777_14326 [Ooceraea biroi]RLU21156.1 hypothetical protein DMN91_005529 [Ooceraea biroi]
MKVTTLKGIFPDPKPVRRRNFIQENVKNLRRMEQCFQSGKEVDKLEKLQLHKCKTRDKYQNVSAKVVTSFRDKKKHAQRNDIDPGSKDHVDPASIDKMKVEKPSQNGVSLVEPCKKHVGDTKRAIRAHTDSDTLSRQKKSSKHKNEQKQQPKDSSEPSNLQKYNDNAANDSDASSIKYKSQGIQTLDTDETESIYSEGIILYPSKKVIKHNEIASNGDLNRQEETTLRKQSDSPTDRGDMRTPEDSQKTDLRNSASPALREEIDFVKLNKERTSVATKLATQLNNGVPPPNYRKGVVPKYLRERKEAQEKEKEQKAKVEASHADCPEGHVSLPDHERKETLRLLKKNYQDYVNELNMMPIKTDTLRAQRRKMEIEKQLTKLEEGIKVFSRPKVYVKINA